MSDETNDHPFDSRDKLHSNFPFTLTWIPVIIPSFLLDLQRLLELFVLYKAFCWLSFFTSHFSSGIQLPLQIRSRNVIQCVVEGQFLSFLDYLMVSSFRLWNKLLGRYPGSWIRYLQTVSFFTNSGSRQVRVCKATVIPVGITGSILIRTSCHSTASLQSVKTFNTNRGSWSGCVSCWFNN